MQFPEHTIEKLSRTELRLSNPHEDIRSYGVKDSQGEKLGRVDELMVDSNLHKVRFLQVGSGGFLGVGREHFLIPVDAISYIDREAKEVLINQTRERISRSPAYAPDLEVDHPYYQGLYEYYGYTPYWGADYKYPVYPNYPRDMMR